MNFRNIQIEHYNNLIHFYPVTSQKLKIIAKKGKSEKAQQQD